MTDKSVQKKDVNMVEQADLAHVEGEAEEDQVQSAPLHQNTGVLDGGADRLHLVEPQTSFYDRRT